LAALQSSCPSSKLIFVHHPRSLSIFTGSSATESPPPPTENAEKSAAAEEGKEQPKAEKSDSELKLIDAHALLKAQHDDLMDKYRRSIAESDNMRKRLTKQGWK
jgi:molecular chaperone GrpE (heat shock protein)